MLGTLDELSLDQAEGKMNIAVGAQSVGRVELAILGAIEGVGLLAVIKADDVSTAQIGSGTSFDPAFRVRIALGGVTGFVRTYSRCREPALDVISGILDLPEYSRHNFTPGREEAWIGCGTVVLHDGMQPGQRVIRHQREHMVLNVVVHVPVQITVDPAHVHRAAVEPVIEHILSQTRVLRVSVSDQQPGAEQIRQPYQQQGKDAAAPDRQPNDDKVDGDIYAGPAINLGKLYLGNVRFFLGKHAPQGMQGNLREILPIHLEVEERHDHALQVRWARDSDLRVTADDNGVAVVTGVTPAPEDGLPHDHERRNFIESVIHPIRLERGTVAGSCQRESEVEA